MPRLSLALLCIASALVVAQGQSANLVNKYASDGTFTAATAQNCDTSGKTDYFPNKAPTVFAKFAVEYRGYYKIVTVQSSPEPKKYLLVQRGCPTPVGVTADKTFIVPLTSVSVSSSTWHKFFEAMGERGTIKATEGFYSSSPCLNKLTVDKAIVDSSMYSYSEAEGYYTTGANNTKTPDAKFTSTIEASFVDGVFSTGKNEIIVGDNNEATYQAVSEWIHYIAAFYNREAEVSAFASQSRGRWVCHSTTTMRVTGARPKAIWVNYLPQAYGKTSPKGWIINTCKSPNDPSYRYCDLIKSANADVISDFYGTSVTSPDLFDKANGQILGVSDADMLAYAREADVIIIANQYCSAWTETGTVESCDAYYNGLVKSLTGTKAFANKQIFDIGRKQDPSGGSAILEAVVEPDVMLQDMIKAVRPSLQTEHKFIFLRNMQNEGVGNQRTCAQYPSYVGCIPTAEAMAAACTNVATSGMVSYAEPCIAVSSGANLLPSIYMMFAALLAAAALFV